jgi:hypothetical protein
MHGAMIKKKILEVFFLHVFAYKNVDQLKVKYVCPIW